MGIHFIKALLEQFPFSKHGSQLPLPSQCREHSYCLGDRGQACGHPLTYRHHIQGHCLQQDFGQPEVTATTALLGHLPCSGPETALGRQAQLQPAACTAASNNAPSLQSLASGVCSSLALAGQEGKHFLTFVPRASQATAVQAPGQPSEPGACKHCGKCGQAHPWRLSPPSAATECSSGVRGVGEKR